MKSLVNGSNTIAMAALLMAGVLIFMATTTCAAPHIFSPGYYSSMSYENQNPEYLLQTLARLRQALLAEEDLEKNPELLEQQKHNQILLEESLNRQLGTDSSTKSLRAVFSPWASWSPMDLGLSRGSSGSNEAMERVMQELALSPSGPQEYLYRQRRDFGTSRGRTGDIEALVRVTAFCANSPSVDICRHFG
ncbi:hypothetical protein QE152_g3861 [Popillia japonica]|uniref:Uncharacterized protein n=1 Tax=Popillia japonica TaxID=7064 RepID=A0AAW1N356_POPJA